MYGNYQILNYGHSCDSIHDLTGAPTVYIDLRKDKK